MEPHFHLFFGYDDDVIVATKGRQCANSTGGHATGHAEMDDPGPAIVELNQEVLGTAFQGLNTTAFEASSKVRRQRHPEIGAPRHGTNDAFPHQHTD